MKSPKKSAATSPPQPTANPDRGENELTLGGVTYRLRPSYGAVQAIEKKTGRTLIVLARLANVGDLSLEQVGIVAAELIRAGATDDFTAAVSAEKIGELAFEEGLPIVTARLSLALIDAATGGRTASGEAKPVAMTEAPATGG